MLAKFRAIRSTPEDLQRLLEARADPSMTVGEGSLPYGQHHDLRERDPRTA